MSTEHFTNTAVIGQYISVDILIPKHFDKAEFFAYLDNERSQFVIKFWQLFPDVEQRVVAENLLLAFDQLRQRYIDLLLIKK